MDTRSSILQPLPLRTLWLFDCTELATTIEVHHRAPKNVLVPMTLYHLYREFHLINHQEYNHLAEPWARYYTQYQNWLRPMLHPLGWCVVQYQLRFANVWLSEDTHDSPYHDDLYVQVTRYPLESRGS